MRCGFRQLLDDGTTRRCRQQATIMLDCVSPLALRACERHARLMAHQSRVKRLGFGIHVPGLEVDLEALPKRRTSMRDARTPRGEADHPAPTPADPRPRASRSPLR